jgi:hypothetical protein
MQHIALSTPDAEWSAPLNLEDSRSIEEDKRSAIFMTRKTSSPPSASSNVALLMTTHQRDGQVFFVVCDNVTPALTLNNGLETAIRYGQSMKNYGLPLTSDLFVGERFQVLASHRSCLYAMPWLNQNFPFKDGIEEVPSLILTAAELLKKGWFGILVIRMIINAFYFTR